VFRAVTPPRARKIEPCGLNAGSRGGECVYRMCWEAETEIPNEAIYEIKIVRQEDKT
jgi:hypothetical protein